VTERTAATLGRIFPPKFSFPRDRLGIVRQSLFYSISIFLVPVLSSVAGEYPFSKYNKIFDDQLRNYNARVDLSAKECLQPDNSLLMSEFNTLTADQFVRSNHRMQKLDLEYFSEGETCVRSGLKSFQQFPGVYRCDSKNEKSKDKTPDTSDAYARFLAVTLNAAADCLDLKDYRRFAFGMMMKEANLQVRVQSSTGAANFGPFQIHPVAIEDVGNFFQDTNSNHPEIRRLSSSLENAFKIPAMDPRGASCLPFQNIYGSIKNAPKISSDPCGSLLPGHSEGDALRGQVFLGISYLALNLSRIQKVMRDIGLDSSPLWENLGSEGRKEFFSELLSNTHNVGYTATLSTLAASWAASPQNPLRKKQGNGKSAETSRMEFQAFRNLYREKFSSKTSEKGYHADLLKGLEDLESKKNQGAKCFP
jgi:hypothetical protein